MMPSLTWHDVEDVIVKLSNDIRSKGAQLNHIVAVSRGGLIPARLLSTHLGIKRLSSIGIMYLGPERATPEVYSRPEPIGSMDRILLIEDALETGRSLRDAFLLLTQLGARVSTAAIFQSSGAIFAPDFSVGIVDPLPQFPWDD